jgi:eukaryotic-like serine/threonine-protein kinase
MSPDTLFAGRYELEDRLGVGGMSTVQRAFDTRLERHVAVKLLAEHLAADGAFVARFRREALAAARLVHPNVVQVYDFGTDDASGRQFIAMEYVAGESCAEILRERGYIPPDEAVDILAQACRGLEYAHRNGVVHRDVKPGNLLRSRDGVIKLADFGIAKAADDSDITKVGSVVGTAAYLAPEQARGEPAGPASDIYALGVVAYQLLAGRLPYEGSSLTELARLQELGPPDRLDRVVEGVPAALAEAVQRALSGLPEARYASATEMESALRDGLRGVAPAAGASGWDPGEDATHRLDPTDATSAMPATAAATTPRRRLEPLPEEPRRRPPSRRDAAPPARRKRRRTGRWLALLVALALAATVGFLLVDSVGQEQRIQLREDVRGTFDEALDEVRQLVEDNTR